jgi:hypothetical protein
MKRKRAGLMTAVLGAAGLVVFAHAIAAYAAGIAGASARPVQDRQTNQQPNQRNLPPDFMGLAGITGWVLAGTPRTYPREGLYGYVDGGAEIFLQYGFRNLTVFELVPEKTAGSKKSITLEIYRMDSPAAAFGIFSTRREGGEPVLSGIKTINWIGPEQANLVKSDLYVNILASGCTLAEVEDFALSLAGNLPPGETPLPSGFSCMPEFNLVPGSERYICGGVAAANESPLLGADFWGFSLGQAEAYSAKYGPGPSKLVLIRFKEPPKDLVGKVFGLFNEYLMDVTMMDQIMQGRTVVGRKFYFGWNGPNGILILDEPDPKAARARIAEALKKAAQRLEEKPEKKTDKEKK